MYEPIEDVKAFDMLKDKGNQNEIEMLALNGMELSIANVNNVSMDSVGVDQAVKYLRDTYLESIDSVSFFEWITKGNEDGKPVILSESHFKSLFEEISNMNVTLQGMCDDIAILYGQEWWTFGYEEWDVFLATTTYKDDYKEINLTEVNKAMSYFCAVFDVLHREDVDLDNWQDVIEEKREQFISDINKSANNLLENYDIEDMNDAELIELVDSKLGLGYTS